MWDNDDQVAWFSYKKAGSKSVPIDDLCECCGLALEAWPLADKQTLKQKHGSSETFRAEFRQVRQGVAIAKRLPWRRQEVRAEKSVGVRLGKTAAFVEVDVLKPALRVAPEELKLSIVHLKGPDGKIIAGVLLQKHSVPPTLPHYHVECFTENVRLFDDWLLTGEDQLREPQAAERFALATANMQQSDMVTKLSKVPDYVALQKAAKDVEQERELAMQASAGAAEVVPQAVEVTDRSRLADASEGAFAAPPAAKRAQRNGAAKAAAGSRGRGGRAGAGRQTAGRAVGLGVRSLCGAASVAPSMTAPSVGRSVAGGSQQGDLLMALDAESAAPSAENVGADGEEDPFIVELHNMMLGENLGRQMKTVHVGSRLQDKKDSATEGCDMKDKVLNSNLEF